MHLLKGEPAEMKHTIVTSVKFYPLKVKGPHYALPNTPGFMAFGAEWPVWGISVVLPLK